MGYFEQGHLTIWNLFN